MKQLRLFLLFAFTVLLCTAAVCAGESAQGVPYGYVFEEIKGDDGSVTGLCVVAYNDEQTSLTVPSESEGVPVIAVGREAFAENTRIKSVKLPQSVTEIGEAAFRGCTYLTKVTLPSSLVSLPPDAFRGCTALADIKLPGSLTDIGDGAFYGCTLLPSITIPASVTEIGEEAFWGCESLVMNCSENAYAAAFAKSHMIETSHDFTWLIVLLLFIVIVFAYLVIRARIIRSKRKKERKKA